MTTTSHRELSAERGFTLIELMIVATLIVGLAAVGYPAFTKWKKKADLMAQASEAAIHLQIARQEAVKMGVPVVVEIDATNGELFSFANVDGDGGPVFSPDTTKTFRTVDYEVGRYEVPPDLPLYLKGPNNDPAVVGFDTNPDGKPIIVFQPNGGIRDPGSLRIADAGANVLELNLNSTGKVQLLKYNSAPAWGSDPGYYPNGRHEATGKPLWVWY